MIKIDVEIEGICPMLFNNFFDPDSLKGTSKKKTQKEYDDETKYRVYRKNGKGPIGVEATALKKCIILGAMSAGLKIGRKGAAEYLRATVFATPDFMSLGKKDPDGIHECTARVPPRTGGRVQRKRPYVDTGWKLPFQLLLTDGRITPDMAKIALEEAGLVKGLYDHRPEYGRFKINKFKEAKP